MDDFLLNRMLSERLRDRLKKQAHTEIVSLKECLSNADNLLIFQKSFPVFSLRSFAASSCGLIKIYP